MSSFTVNTPASSNPSGTGRAAFPDPPDSRAEIKHLRQAWEEAKRRQAANEALAIKLLTAITPATKPDDASRLNAQATTASGQATDAGTEADGYALKASYAVNGLRSERPHQAGPTR